MKFVKRIMINSKQRANDNFHLEKKSFFYSQLANSRGVLLLNAVLIISLVLIIIGLLNSNIASLFKNYAFERNKLDSQRTLATLQTWLSDRRLCNAFFHDGYATSAGLIEFKTEQFESYNAKHLSWIQARINLLSSNLGGFGVKSFNLENPKDIVTSPTGSKIKQFDVEVTLEHSEKEVAPGVIRTTLGKVGTATMDLSEKMTLVLGEKGECYLRGGTSEDTATGLTINAYKDSCKALGGKFKDARCYTKEFEVDNLDIPQVADPPIEDKSSFTDALCEMELNLLKKSTIDNVGAGKSEKAAWTTLCQKPLWSGCYDDKNGNNAILPNGGAADYKQEMKQKDVSDYMQNEAKDTIKLRASRVAFGYDPKGQSLNFKDNSGPDGGMTMAAFAASTAAIAVAGPAGIAIFIIQLLMKCDKAWVTEKRTCRNGHIEIDNFSVKWEEMGFLDCDKKGPKDYPTLTIDQVRSQLGISGSQNIDFNNSATSTDIDSGFQKYNDRVNNANPSN